MEETRLPPKPQQLPRNKREKKKKKDLAARPCSGSPNSLLFSLSLSAQPSVTVLDWGGSCIAFWLTYWTVFVGRKEGIAHGCLKIKNAKLSLNSQHTESQESLLTGELLSLLSKRLWHILVILCFHGMIMEEDYFYSRKPNPLHIIHFSLGPPMWYKLGLDVKQLWFSLLSHLIFVTSCVTNFKGSHAFWKIGRVQKNNNLRPNLFCYVFF